jgi:peptide/nickel transport system substrate-binding protein
LFLNRLKGEEDDMKKMVITIFLVILFVGGCTVNVSKTNTPQHLIIAEQHDLRGYDPGSSMSDFIRALIFNNLIELNANFEKVAALASEWSYNEDATQWTLRLKENVKFHDGEPFNAQAVKVNLDYRRETTGKAWLSNVQSIEVLGEYEIMINLHTSNVTFDSDLTPPFLAMISPKSINDKNEVIAAIGTGPFKLQKWEKDQQFELIRNEDYYDGKPKLEVLTFRVIPDAQTRALALENGEVHMMNGREALSVVTRLQGNQDIMTHSKTGQTSEIVYFQTTKGPLEDIRIRKAIISAVDLGDAIKTLLPNMAVEPRAFFSEVLNLTSVKSIFKSMKLKCS